MADAPSLRVLLVEDDPAMVVLVRRLLEASGYQQIQHVGTGADALTASAEADLIVLDHQLPDMTGVDLLPRLIARPEPPSVILVTGTGNETLAAAALRAGADDYVPKDAHFRELLPQIVERVRRTRALRSAQTAVEQELIQAERLAAIGEMTVTLHHEINNPLMSASAETELLAADRSLSDDQRGSVEAIKSALTRVRDIIKRAGELREAASRDYLVGLRMINLAESDPAKVPHRGRALLLIAEEGVARLTALVLRHSGFTVERVGSVRELESGANRLGVSLVVLSAVGTDDPEDALGGLRVEPGRAWGLVALVAGDGSGAEAAGADRVVSLPLDPATFADDLLAAADREVG
ncbi:MAG: response regulator [Gemmatimonadales bacterium]